MAVTGIWKIESRLDHVIDYICNVEKTNNVSHDELFYQYHKLQDNQEKNSFTEEQRFISGINCTPEIAYKEMIATKQAYNKTSGIIGFHGFQSFKEGEVSPEIAHEIGLKLANELWGDRFEVIVSTHLDKKHIHNHFVLNSVSFKDGKKYYDKRSTYAGFRKTSDMLCEEYNLSVIKEKKEKNKINFDNYYKSYIKNDNYYTSTKKDVDYAIKLANTFSEFESILKVLDYKLIYRSDKLSVRREPYKKNIRIERIFGNDYSLESIKKRIVEETTIEKNTSLKSCNFFKVYKSNKNKKRKGIFGLYLHYCYLLNVFPQKKQYKIIIPEIKTDLRKLDEINREIIFLIDNNLDNDHKFLNYKKRNENKLNRLLDMRNSLWYKHKMETIQSKKDTIIDNITSLNKEINILKKEVKMCEQIEERSILIKENYEKLEKVNREESIKNVQFR